MTESITIQEIKDTIVQVLKEEIPHFAKAQFKAKEPASPESVRSDLRDDAINEYLGSLSDLESSMSTVVMSLQKLQTEYQISEAGKEGFPFQHGIDDMYKAIVHWNATQQEILTNRFLNAK